MSAVGVSPSSGQFEFGAPLASNVRRSSEIVSLNCQVLGFRAGIGLRVQDMGL